MNEEMPLPNTPWKSPKDELPPEGQKVLSETGGHVAFVHWDGTHWYWYEFRYESKWGPDHWCPIPPIA